MSQRTTSRQNHSNGSHEDLEIVPETAVLQIEQVEIHLAAETFDVVVVTVDDLSKTRETRLQAQSVDVVGDFGRECFDEFRPLWAGANQRHFTTQNVPQLWQFVQACLAKKSPDTGNSWVALHGELSTVFLGVDFHRAEFVERKWLSVSAITSSVTIGIATIDSIRKFIGCTVTAIWLWIAQVETDASLFEDDRTA